MGTDWGEEGLKPTSDLVPTFNEVLTFAGVGHAQNAYQTIQANNVFENKDFLAADEFVDADGTNNTVNTGSTTGIYNSTDDTYNLNDGANETATLSAGTFTTVTNMTWTGTANVQGFINKVTASTQNIGSDWVGNIEIKDSGSVTIASKTGYTLTDNTLNQDIDFVQGDYSSLLSAAETFSVVFTRTSGTGTLRTATATQNYTGTNWDLSGTGNYDGTEGEFQEVRSSAVVVCDTGIKTLDGTEETIVVYGDKTTPTNTTLTVDITDGTTTLSAQSLNTVIELAGFVAGTLKLTFNLATTDVTVTPTLKGYGVYIR